MGHCGNGQAGDGGEKCLRDRPRKVGGVGVGSFILKDEKGVVSGEDGAEKSEDGSDTGDCGNGPDPALEDRNLNEGCGLDRPTNAANRCVVVEQCGFDDVGDRPRCLFTHRKRLGETAFAQEVLDPIHEGADLDLTLVEKKGALDEEDEAEDTNDQERPHNGAALLEEREV